MEDKSVVSLFCGAGGLDIGFHKAGYTTIWANDFNEDACDTFRLWSPNTTVVCGDISKVDFDEIPESDIITGGFPCFVAGTLITTENGLIPIEDVIPGMKVLTHRGRWQNVVSTMTKENADTVVVSTEALSVECTPEHPFYVAGEDQKKYEWVAAKETIGRFCLIAETVSSKGEPAIMDSVQAVVSIKNANTNIKVYNLEVDEDNSYVANSFVVHNCQGFSMAGPRKLNDSRNSLYKNFVRLVSLKKPEAFVAENVKGLLTIGGSDEIANTIVSDFAELGYQVSLTLVDANDYGVPENRMRTIIVGIRNDLNKRFYMPRPDTVKKTIGDVLSPDDAVDMDDVCQQPYSSRYMSRNRIRTWNQPSFTIPAMAKQVALWPGSPAMKKIDSDHWDFGGDTTRRLSYKEAAKIQTFPDDMVFCGDLVSKYKQIGNAVPPQLGYAVAKRLEEILNDTWDSDDIVDPLICNWD